MAWPTITFSDIAKANSVTVNMPGWGYETEIHMPIAITQAEDGKYPDNGFFDPLNAAGTLLGTFDYRVLSSCLWRMTPQQKSDFNAFMRNVSRGRAQDMVMGLGVSNIGFYPFGIDMSDTDDFIVREINRDQSGKQMRPFRWSEDGMSLIMISHVGVSFSAAPSSQGKLFIGDIVNGFMYPPGGIKPKPTYAFATQLSVSGAPSSINGPLTADSWETSFDLYCNTYNAWALIDQLVNKTRTADIPLIVPDHFDLFGADQSVGGAGGTYTAKFLGSSRSDKEIVIKITHVGFNQFKIPLTFWMKSKAA
jgi:hypothetical protein